KEEARKLQVKISGSGDDESETPSAFQRLAVRAYRVTRSDLINRSVGELESRPREARVFISRMRREGKIIEPKPDTVVREGDTVAVLAHSELLMARGAEIGTEVNDKELLDFPIEFLDVVITNKSVVGKSIAELAAMEFAKGVLLKKLTRTGQDLPFLPETRVERGDLLTLFSAESDVERAAKNLGYADHKTVMTDMILFGRYVLKMNPVIVLGACSGAGTITAALRAIQEEAESVLPALGYTVPYAIGNIVLTAWGPVLVAMMS